MAWLMSLFLELRVLVVTGCFLAFFIVVVRFFQLVYCSIRFSLKDQHSKSFSTTFCLDTNLYTVINFS
jgi:hypothetical protein